MTGVFKSKKVRYILTFQQRNGKRNRCRLVISKNVLKGGKLYNLSLRSQGQLNRRSFLWEEADPNKTRSFIFVLSQPETRFRQGHTLKLQVMPTGMTRESNGPVPTDLYRSTVEVGWGEGRGVGRGRLSGCRSPQPRTHERPEQTRPLEKTSGDWEGNEGSVGPSRLFSLFPRPQYQELLLRSTLTSLTLSHDGNQPSPVCPLIFSS